jgi:oxygen-independent coproporphyrinogen-3 oxidase
MQETIRQTIALHPDRIAFYSYAHVPWASRAQRLFDENDLPSTAVKMQLYRMGKEMFTEAGYRDIGMDHFALKNDELFLSRKGGYLHRNFMGYTTQHTKMLVGLGVSAISDAGMGYAQNNKTLHEYTAAIEQGELAVNKGIFLTEEDNRFRQYILNISCRGYTRFLKKDLPVLEQYCFPLLQDLADDGLIEWNHESLQVTALGENFIRNICYPFDLHVQCKPAVEMNQRFSKAI